MAQSNKKTAGRPKANKENKQNTGVKTDIQTNTGNPVSLNKQDDVKKNKDESQSQPIHLESQAKIPNTAPNVTALPNNQNGSGGGVANTSHGGGGTPPFTPNSPNAGGGGGHDTTIGQPFIDPSLKQEVIEEPVSDFKNENTIVDSWGKPIDLNKAFICKKGTQFLEGGSIKISVDNTKIQRVDEIFYTISGIMPENGSPFTIPFESLDKQEADELWDELCEYERHPEKFIVIPPATPAGIGSPAGAGAPPAPFPNTTPPNVIPPPSMGSQGAGVPLTSMNIDELIKKLPDAPPPAHFPQMMSPPMGNATDISHIINNQQAAETQAYANSILDHLKGSWKVGAWGGVPLSDVQEFINSHQCSKDYAYELRNDTGGYYLVVSKGQVSVRVPAAENEFLPII